MAKKKKEENKKPKLYYSLIDGDLYIDGIKIEKSGSEFNVKDSKRMKRALEIEIVECR